MAGLLVNLHSCAKIGRGGWIFAAAVRQRGVKRGDKLWKSSNTAKLHFIACVSEIRSTGCFGSIGRAKMGSGGPPSRMLRRTGWGLGGRQEKAEG